MSDVAPKRVNETEGDIRLVSVHDHRRELSVQRIPDNLVIGKRRESTVDSRAVFRDVPAVKAQSRLADQDGGSWIRGFEGAFGPKGVFAQFGVKVIEDGEDELRRCHPPRCVIGTIVQTRVALPDQIVFRVAAEHC
jgi:hypothetical protein